MINIIAAMESVQTLIMEKAKSMNAKSYPTARSLNKMRSAHAQVTRGRPIAWKSRTLSPQAHPFLFFTTFTTVGIRSGNVLIKTGQPDLDVRKNVLQGV